MLDLILANYVINLACSMLIIVFSERVYETLMLMAAVCVVFFDMFLQERNQFESVVGIPIHQNVIGNRSR